MFKVGDRVLARYNDKWLAGTIIHQGLLPAHVIDEDKEVWMVLYDDRARMHLSANWHPKSSIKLVTEPNDIMKGLL